MSEFNWLADVVERRAFLLEELDKFRPTYDELEHGPNCNTNPAYYQRFDTLDYQKEVRARGCDCYPIRRWKERLKP